MRTKVAKPILKNAIPDLLISGSYGIFDHIPGVPWDVSINTRLDQLLYLNHGNKPVSPLAIHYMEGTDGELYTIENSAKTQIGALLATIYLPRWKRLYDINATQYNPLENYNMMEHEATSETGRNQKQSSQNAQNREDQTFAETINDSLTDSTEARQNSTRGVTRKETETNANTRNLVKDEQITRDTASSSVHDTNRMENSESDEKTTQTAANTSEQVQNGTTSETNKIYGFNSTDGVNNTSNSGKSDSTGQTSASASGTSTASKTGTNSETATDTELQTGSDTEHHTGGDTESQSHSRAVSGDDIETLDGTDSSTATHTRELGRGTSYTKNNAISGASMENGQQVSDGTRALTRHGNIGVTTTQQMITSEIALWNWKYFESVVKDVADFLCLSVY